MVPMYTVCAPSKVLIEIVKDLEYELVMAFRLSAYIDDAYIVTKST